MKKKINVLNNLLEDRTKNIFDTVRLAAASMVLLHHSFVLFNPKFDPIAFTSRNMFNSAQLTNYAVLVFFILSGLLVTASFNRNPSFYKYFKSRILRIFPALFTSVVLVTLLAGFISEIGLKAYFTSGVTYRYLENIFVFFISYSLPGVFLNNPFQGAVNGSLWTIPIEFFCYIIVYIVLSSVKKRKVRFIILSIISLLYMLIHFIGIPKLTDIVLFSISFGQAFPLIISFLIGMIAYYLKDKIEISFKYLMIASLIFVADVYFINTGIVYNFALAYIVFFVSGLNWRFLQFPLKIGDISYGVYIYSFPIQQFLIYFYKDISLSNYIIASFAVSFLVALVSWHFIEKRALRCK